MIFITRYESEREPRKCPKCGSTKIATFLYGMPAFSDQLQKDLDEGKIVLGGCCISDDDPTWQCTACSTDIYKTTTPN